jgi:hypothetical protein
VDDFGLTDDLGYWGPSHKNFHKANIFRDNRRHFAAFEAYIRIAVPLSVSRRQARSEMSLPAGIMGYEGGRPQWMIERQTE